MIFKWLFDWADRFFGFKPVLRLPVFYVVIEDPGTKEQKAHETTRSIHRARGIAREKQANGIDVALATYVAESITKEV